MLKEQVTFIRGKSLSKLSTFGIGGEAKYYIVVKSIPQMQQVLAYCHAHQISFFILGRGSNCLFDDRGFDGVVIHNKIEFIEQYENMFFVGAGFSFPLLGIRSSKQGWSGLEFAPGIPASVGGAVFMNAGIGKHEVKDTLFTVHYVDEKGKRSVFRRNSIAMAYRFSSFQNMKGAVVAATFRLKPSATSKEYQKKLLDQRIDSQPYKDKSAGCIFRNPSKECPAGHLIDKCGLKGFKIGGAMISPKHANFIVNEGSAKTKDVIDLISYVKNIILKEYGLDLYEEVKVIPYEGSLNVSCRSPLS